MSDSRAHRISVALVTRNRLGSLRRTLASLRAQSAQPFEVTISDDSDDAIGEQVEKMSGEFGCTYLRGPRRGLYANRNHAALACRGTHIRTMDDDHEFPAGHFAAVADAVAGSPEDIWVIPERMRPDDPASTQFPSQLGPSGYGYAPPDRDDCWAIADGCTVYPAEIFRSGGRMIEEWPFGQAYLEFGARLHFQQGRRCRLVAGTYVIHHHEPGLRQSQHDLIEGASAVYAALAFSWGYQPSFGNRLATLQRFALLVLRRGGSGWKSLRWGAAVFHGQGVPLPAPPSGERTCAKLIQ